MSDYKTPDGTLFLWTNQRRSQKHPDYYGNVVMPDGQKWSAAAWEGTTKKGDPYLKVLFSTPRDADGNDADDVPF